MSPTVVKRFDVIVRNILCHLDDGYNTRIKITVPFMKFTGKKYTAFNDPTNDFGLSDSIANAVRHLKKLIQYKTDYC